MDKLSGEVAYVAYHFHWGMDDILEMEHKERHMWIKEISEIKGSGAITAPEKPAKAEAA